MFCGRRDSFSGGSHSGVAISDGTGPILKPSWRTLPPKMLPELWLIQLTSMQLWGNFNSTLTKKHTFKLQLDVFQDNSNQLYDGYDESSESDRTGVIPDKETRETQREKRNRRWKIDEAWNVLNGLCKSCCRSLKVSPYLLFQGTFTSCNLPSPFL